MYVLLPETRIALCLICYCRNNGRKPLVLSIHLSLHESPFSVCDCYLEMHELAVSQTTQAYHEHVNFKYYSY